MSSLSLRDEFVTRFGAIDGVRTAVPHDQDWDLAELKRIGASASPRVLVTCVGMAEANEDRGPVGTYRWVAVIVARRGDIHYSGVTDEDLASPGDVAMLLEARVVRELLGDEFTEACGRPNGIQAANFSDAGKASRGVAARVVTWEQDAAIDDNVELVLVDLETIVSDHDVTGDGESDVQTAAGGPYVAEEDGETPVLDESGQKVRTESID